MWETGLSWEWNRAKQREIMIRDVVPGPLHGRGCHTPRACDWAPEKWPIVPETGELSEQQVQTRQLSSRFWLTYLGRSSVRHSEFFGANLATNWARGVGIHGEIGGPRNNLPIVDEPRTFRGPTVILSNSRTRIAQCRDRLQVKLFLYKFVWKRVVWFWFLPFFCS